MKKKWLVLLLVLAVLVTAATAVAAVKLHRQENNQIMIDGQAYNKDAESLNLRGKELSIAEFEAISGEMPQCQILWDVPFQGSRIPSSTEILTVSSLTEEDAALLGYFPNLREMDAMACRDYDILQEVLEKRPRCRIRYEVEIGSQLLDRDTNAITLSEGESSGDELMERIPCLKELRKIRLEEPEISAADLRKLMDAFPQIEFSWRKTIFGKKVESSIEFLDLSGKKFKSLQEVQRQLAYLPNLKQVDMLNCGFTNPEMRKFRDQVRNDYKVVFNVQVGTMDLRTDIKDFFPDRDHGKVRNSDTENLRYCEDLICVDVGHLGFSNIDWVEGTPHLKYLIMSDGGAADLTPLGQLQELEFLELFMTGVVDTSPLVNCKGLRDLNLCRAPLGDITPLTKMKWLEKLWVSHCPLDPEERQQLRSSLPNTHIEFDEFYSTWGGWRDMPRYFEMRDILKAPYMR